MKYNLFVCDNHYCIHEDKSLKILKRTRDKKFAKILLKCLNSGSGFDGNTPDFFVFKEDRNAVFGR